MQDLQPCMSDYNMQVNIIYLEVFEHMATECSNDGEAKGTAFTMRKPRLIGLATLRRRRIEELFKVWVREENL